MEYLSRPDTHRVVVTSANGTKVEAILTQSRVVQWLYDNRNKLGFPEEGKEMKVKDMADEPRVAVPKKEVISVPENKPLMDVFFLMYQKMVSGVAVVNSGGQLIGNISATDLKFISGSPTELMQRLDTTAIEFLEWRSGQPRFSEQDLLKDAAFALPLTCTLEDTLLTVLKKLKTKGTHRLWLIDADNKPIGVISLCDIINMFAHLDVVVV
jgi:CBS domain-containing protein